MRYFFAAFIIVVVTVVGIAGFRGSKSPLPPIEIFPDMDHQPKFKAQAPSDFFADGRSNRLPVPGTVAFEEPGDLGYRETGRMGSYWGNGIPVDVNAELLERGRQRFDINCAVCHGKTGNGDGIVTQYGLKTVASLQQDRIRTMPDGQIFNTITHGYGQMAPYSHVKIQDRWAIIAYVRALQMSQNSTIEDVPAGKRKELE